MNIKKNTVDEFEKVLEGAFNDKELSKVKLIEMVEPLIKSSMKKYYYGDTNKEDLIQEGRFKILDCLETFDKEKGVYFLGYLKAQLRYLYLNLSKFKEFEISLNSKIDLGEGSVEMIDTLIDENVDIDGDFVKKCENENLRNTMDILTEREAQVLKMYYFEDMGMKDIAKDLGLAYRTVVNTKTNGLEKLRSIILSH